MAENGWKDKVGGIPLFGRLLAMLRGCWTLPVWRQALRDDTHRLRLEFDHLRDRQADLQQRLAEALPRRDAEAWIAAEAHARASEAEARLTEFQGQLQRLFDDDARSRMVAEQRLQEFERNLRAMRETWSALAPAEPPASAAAGSPPANGLRPWPGVAAAVPDAQELERWREPLRARLAAVPRTAPSCDLSGQPPERWAEILRETAAASQAAILAAEGAASFDRGQQLELLALAATRLRPGGWVALGYPNPENLAVLLQQARDPRPGLLAAGPVRAIFAAAGFADLELSHCDAPMPPLAEQAGEPAEVRQAWAQPRRFWVVGHRSEA